MDKEALMDGVRLQCGWSDPGRVEGAIGAVLEGIAQGIPIASRPTLGEALPHPFARVVASAPYRGEIAPGELAQRIHDQQGGSAAAALELVKVVCGVLARELDFETRSWLRRHLPDPWADLLAEPPEVAEAVAVERGPAAGAGTTLATGRPGSRHPLSEAAPRAAHAHSVAQVDNPHADTKLSSGHPRRGEPESDNGR